MQCYVWKPDLSILTAFLYSHAPTSFDSLSHAFGAVSRENGTETFLGFVLASASIVKTVLVELFGLHHEVTLLEYVLQYPVAVLLCNRLLLWAQGARMRSLVGLRLELAGVLGAPFVCKCLNARLNIALGCQEVILCIGVECATQTFRLATPARRCINIDTGHTIPPDAYAPGKVHSQKSGAGASYQDLSGAQHLWQLGNGLVIDDRRQALIQFDCGWSAVA